MADEVLCSECFDLPPGQARPAVVRRLPGQEPLCGDCLHALVQSRKWQQANLGVGPVTVSKAPSPARLSAATKRLLRDQREANESLVLAALESQEQANDASAAQARAETQTSELQESERELIGTAVFRERLLGIVGHDLRGPLNGILMAAGLIQFRASLADEDTDVLDRLIQSGWRMNRMIAQLLEFTRARLGGGIPIAPGPVDLRQVCAQVLGELDISPGIEVRRELAGDLTGTWDADRLAEVLSNLVGNAIEHATRGTAIVVRAWGDGGDVVAEVSNQGDPIPADLLPVLFSPFRRGQQSRHSKAGNLGLGLYIAQEIMRSHGGTLGVQSVGGATTFTLRLPRSQGG